jgi:PAT family beta-lactamase induction signal transducer AmpG
MVGAFALVHIPHALQFLWAPFVDHLSLPYLTRRFGQRRGWALFSQLGLILSLWALSCVDPRTQIGLTALCAFMTSLFASFQEVVLSAYIFDTFDKKHYPPATAMCTVGNRLALIVSGAGALHLSIFYSWGQVYWIMGCCIFVGILTILFSAEPPNLRYRSQEANFYNARPIRSFIKRFKTFFGRSPASPFIWTYASVLLPLLDFKKHKKWGMILIYLSLFKLGDSFVKTMEAPFYLDIGFTKQEIANITKIFGITTAVIGGIIASFVVNRIGVIKSLLSFSILHALSNLMFLLQYWAGHNVGMLYFTIAIEDITGGMASAAFVVYLASLYNVPHRTFQNALFWSLISFSRSIFSSLTGWSADHLTWGSHFTLSFFLAIPAILLFIYIERDHLIPSKSSY